MTVTAGAYLSKAGMQNRRTQKDYTSLDLGSAQSRMSLNVIATREDYHGRFATGNSCFRQY